MTTNSPESAKDHAAEVREARFGTLPERVAFEDLIEEKQALPPNQAADRYDPDSLGTRFACLAADLGL